MDVETYRGVLNARGLDPDKPMREKDKLTMAQRCFRKDLIRDRVAWTDRFCSDYKLYIKTHHPLCLCCCSPKLHPVHGCLGFQLFLVELACNVPLVYVETLIANQVKGATVVFVEIIAILIGAFLLSMISRCILNIGICPCLQGGSKSPCLRCLGTTIGYFFMTMITILFVFFSLWGFLAIKQRHDGTSFGNIGAIYSGALFLDWFLIFPILAMCDYSRHRSREKKMQGKKHFSVSWKDYMAWKEGKPLEKRDKESIFRGVDDAAYVDERPDDKVVDLMVNQMELGSPQSLQAVNSTSNVYGGSVEDIQLSPSMNSVAADTATHDQDPEIEEQQPEIDI